MLCNDQVDTLVTIYVSCARIAFCINFQHNENVLSSTHRKEGSGIQWMGIMRRGIMKRFLKVRVRACHRLPTQGCKLSHRKGRIGHTNGNLSKFQIEIGHRVTGLHIVYISRRTRLIVKKLLAAIVTATAASGAKCRNEFYVVRCSGSVLSPPVAHLRGCAREY